MVISFYFTVKINGCERQSGNNNGVTENKFGDVISLINDFVVINNFVKLKKFHQENYKHQKVENKSGFGDCLHGFNVLYLLSLGYF